MFAFIIPIILTLELQKRNYTGFSDCVKLVVWQLKMQFWGTEGSNTFCVIAVSWFPAPLKVFTLLACYPQKWYVVSCWHFWKNVLVPIDDGTDKLSQNSGDYLSTLCNITKEWRIHLHRGRNPQITIGLPSFHIVWNNQNLMYFHWSYMYVHGLQFKVVLFGEWSGVCWGSYSGFTLWHQYIKGVFLTQNGLWQNGLHRMSVCSNWSLLNGTPSRFNVGVL